MIIQCEECQARFRLADEKIKETGTKVRCSKCKHVFTVTPPAPEPAEESVDFGDFNMEQVTEEAPSAAEDTPGSTPEPEEESGSAATDELDFSGLEDEMGDAGTGEELADDFSFVDTSQESEKTDEDIAQDSAVDDTEAAPGEEPQEFAAAFDETEDDDGPAEFDFGEDSALETSGAEPATEDFSQEAPSEFDFNEEPAAEKEAAPADEFSFGDDSAEGGAFDFDDNEETDDSVATAETPSFESDEAGPSEFSFDEEPSFETDTSSEWDDSDEGSSFDFDEPQFESESEESAPAGEGESLQFGEIDFADDGPDESQDEGPSFGEDDDFSQASLAKEEDESPSLAPAIPEQHTPPPRERDSDDEALLAAPKQKRKSPLSRILVLLVILLLALGGAAAFLYFQEGVVNLNQLVQRFPFLQTYLGQPQEVAEAPRIGISISESVYVDNKEVGQLLVIQGEATNNYPGSRSAITIKGVLQNEQGKTLLQQTVFCGNYLSEQRLQSMPFATIEEAMNNQFGDSLSNMNVAAGTAIPFTIVFRNLPNDIANINVEIVDSKPGQ